MPGPGYFEPCCGKCGGHDGSPQVFVPVAGGRTLPWADKDISLQRDWTRALQGEGGKGKSFWG